MTRANVIALSVDSEAAVELLGKALDGTPHRLFVDGIRHFTIRTPAVDEEGQSSSVAGQIIVTPAGSQIVLDSTPLIGPTVAWLGVGFCALVGLVGIGAALNGAFGGIVATLVVAFFAAALGYANRQAQLKQQEVVAHLNAAFADLPKLAALPAPARSRLLQEHLVERRSQLLLSGAAPGSDGLELDLRHGYVYPLQRALGAVDLLVGDAAFDDRFIVQCNDLPFARAWLSPPIRARLVDLADYIGVHLEAGQLKLTELTSLPSSAERRRAYELGDWLAGRGRGLLDEWRAVAARLGGSVRAASDGWAADGSAAIVVNRGGHDIVIDGWLLDVGGRRLFTRLRCPRVTTSRDELVLWSRTLERSPRLAAPLRTVSVDVDGFDAAYEARASAGHVVPATLASALLACRADCVHVDGEAVTVYLRGFETDDARLMAACELLLIARDDATPQRGPYR